MLALLALLVLALGRRIASTAMEETKPSYWGPLDLPNVKGLTNDDWEGWTAQEKRDLEQSMHVTVTCRSRTQWGPGKRLTVCAQPELLRPGLEKAIDMMVWKKQVSQQWQTGGGGGGGSSSSSGTWQGWSQPWGSQPWDPWTMYLAGYYASQGASQGQAAESSDSTDESEEGSAEEQAAPTKKDAKEPAAAATYDRKDGKGLAKNDGKGAAEVNKQSQPAADAKQEL